MNVFRKIRNRFKRDEKGQGMVEYGLILALVSVVALGALSGLGGQVSEKFDEVGDVMEGPVKGVPIYSEDIVDKKIAEEGYIPISTPEELNSLRDGKEQIFGRGTKWRDTYSSGLDKKYIQVSDINMYAIGNFEPIGHTNKANSFTGEFDGGGYVINNLKVDKGDGPYAGLFGWAEGATLENIGLVGVDVKGGSSVGGLVGYGSPYRITNSYVTGKVTGRHSVGGLVGNHSGFDRGITSNSYSTAEVSGDERVGGLLGYLSGSFRGTTVSDCYATGKVTGNKDVGGLIGHLYSNSNYPHSTNRIGWANDVGSEVTNNRGTGMTKAEIDEIIKSLIK